MTQHKKEAFHLVLAWVNSKGTHSWVDRWRRSHVTYRFCTNASSIYAHVFSMTNWWKGRNPELGSWMGWCKPKIAVTLPPHLGVDLKDTAEGNRHGGQSFMERSWSFCVEGEVVWGQRAWLERLGTRWSGIEAYGWACVSRNMVWGA